VLVDLAVLIADGGEAIGDIDLLRHQPELFGRVASDTMVWRALDELGAVQLRRIAAARAKVRAWMWHLFGGPPGARAAGRDIGTGVVVLDVDSTLLIAHSDKEGAAPTYKHSYRFHPILVTCDSTGELSIRLGPCNAGANAAADHLDILAEAIAQQPAARGIGLRRRLFVALERQAITSNPAVRLETNAALEEAIRLHRSSGYVEVPRFNDETYAHHWFEKHLTT
jgi:GNAT superfamily N-acetyltransferase